MFYLEMRKLECHNMATYLAQERKYVQSWPKTTLIVQMASYQAQKTFIYLGISKGHLYNFFRFHTFMLKSSCKTGAMNCLLFEVNDNQNSWESMTK